MTQQIRFVLALHNHQPVGNFDGVFEQAYQDSYLPFLDVFESYPNLRIALHTSGSLMEWLDEHHSEYVDRLAGLVATGRMEIIGGAFYEPILAMIPSRDRIGQIRRYTEWLQDRLGATIRGMWVPERVWEQSMVSDLAEAGIQYTMLDDFHFKNAGLKPKQLHGYYVSEDNGRVINIFPGSEQMRYLIPFAEPHETINALRRISEEQPNAVVVFGDDGEKFGTWPDTKQHVYDSGWLRRFFDLLVENSGWIKLTTPTEAIENVAPLGKIYLPDGSYREMTEWALPTDKQTEYDHLKHALEHDDRWRHVFQFVRGGFWRNFKVKYPETNEMYARMMQVSRRLDEAQKAGLQGELVDSALQELYRAQCNCSYWHGAFGGVYLPHLRNAVYNHLIAADNLLDLATGRNGQWIEATTSDYNFDARQEICLSNESLIALVAPAQGGILYELDVRSICHNLLATLARRPETYHEKVLAGPSNSNGKVASIHDRVVFKQADLDKRVQYDDYLRKSLIDHFYSCETTLDEVAGTRAHEVGTFVHGPYEARVRRNPERIQIQLTRDGLVEGHPVRITKGVTLEAGSSTLEIAYLLEGLPQDRTFHFAPELNFAGLPSGADDRYFYDRDSNRLGQLGQKLDLRDTDTLGMVDEWLGINVGLTANRPTNFWTYPVETVSQSEGGFELVHQSVVVQPHWWIQGDQHGQWSATLQLSVDTTLAESRMQDTAAVVS